MSKNKDNWHQDLSKSLVAAVHSVVADYRNDKMEALRLAKIKEQESITKQVDPRGSGPYLDKKKKSTKNYHPEESGDAAAYKKFFEKALKKFDVSSPADLKGDKKKEFFDYVDKNWEGDNEKKEEKEIKLSGKKEKVKVNPTVKEEQSLEGYAMGVNPFQRVVQSQKKELTEAFQHTWGYGTPEEIEYREQWMARFHDYVTDKNPHTYIDMLQVKAMYSVGAGPEEAAQRVLGEARNVTNGTWRARHRRGDRALDPGTNWEYTTDGGGSAGFGPASGPTWTTPAGTPGSSAPIDPDPGYE